MPRRYASLLVVSALTFFCASAAPAADSQLWYVVKIGGSPVGFASEIERTDTDRIDHQSHMELSLSRLGTPLSMYMMVEESCDKDGSFVGAAMEMTASITGMSGRATLDGDTLEYRFETSGSTTVKRMVWEDDALSLHQANARMMEFLAGDEPELELKTFRVDEGRFIVMRVVRKESTTETIDGREQTLAVTEEYEDDNEVPTSSTSYDEAYQPYRTVMRQMGLEIVVERVTEEEMANIELEPNFDIIRQSMIACEGYPDPPSKVEDVTMRLTLPHPVDAHVELDGPNQRVVERGDDWVDLLVSRDTVSRETMDKDALEPFLRPDRFIQSDHPEIRAVADSIREASGKEGAALASEMAKWVHGYITGKNFEQGFASALEVYRTRTGDCTEHSVLLTALLRAVGIPARPAVGLAYFNGQFIGHMWAEAYVDYWRTFDALDLEGNPVRVRIATSENGEAVDQRALLQAYSVVGGMHAKVVDFHESD